MVYYVLSASGEVITATEKVMRNSEGYISATYIPEGGRGIPFRTLLAAYRHIRDRETKRWKTETRFHIRKGMFHGYYAAATHEVGPFDRGVRSSDRMRSIGKTVTYQILPVQNWND